MPPNKLLLVRVFYYSNKEEMITTPTRKCLIYLVIREMQIKTVIRYFFTLPRNNIKMETKKCW